MKKSDLQFQVHHRTAYQYSGRIDLCHSLLHLKPVEEDGQKVLSHEIEISPEPEFKSTRKDYFGNGTLYFSIQTSHDKLEVSSQVTVEKSVGLEKPPQSDIAWDDADYQSTLGLELEAEVPLLNYLQSSYACPSISGLDQFLKPSLTPGRDVIDLASEVMSRIYTEFDYKPGITQTTTPISTILESKAGVCQDFAHVMIAALRRIGIPTRYVSGYLETVPPPGQEKLQGADATHAWVEVYSSATGWVGFDPTNDKLPGQQHIKVCHGRDYFDVQPMRGMFLGAGNQRLSVEVDVERL